MSKCFICGSLNAKIRESEVKVAQITMRAHVDCNGHSEYRHVTREEVTIAANRKEPK